MSGLRDHLIKLSAFFLKNWRMARRNGFTVFEVGFWPVVNLMSIGLMTSFFAMTPSAVVFVLTGTIALSVVQVCQLDVVYALMFDMWSKSVKHQFVAPVAPWHVVGGAWLMGTLRGVAVFAIQSLTAVLWFGVGPFRSGLGPALLFLAGLLLSAAVVGLVICTLLLTFGLRAEVSAWSGVSLILLICGVYYPVSVLPAPFQWLAGAVPITYFLEAFRAHHGFAPVHVEPLGRGFGLVGLYLVLGYLTFTAAMGRARRSGMLLKLSD